MRRAILAGVDTIEHGTEANEEVIKLMGEKGVPYFPTLTAVEAYCEYFQGYKRGTQPYPEDLLQAEKTFRMALKNGVPIGLGSDVGVFTHGDNYREAEWMVRFGMRPAQVLLAATALNAKLLRMQDKLGMIKPNFLADLIAVPGNPVEDISAIKQVKFVMKDGKVYKQPGL